MPVVSDHTDTYHQIEQRDQENGENPGLYDPDPFAGGGSEVERAFGRATTHTGQASEAFLGFHDRLALHIDQ